MVFYFICVTVSSLIICRFFTKLKQDINADRIFSISYVILNMSFFMQLVNYCDIISLLYIDDEWRCKAKIISYFSLSSWITFLNKTKYSFTKICYLPGEFKR